MATKIDDTIVVEEKSLGTTGMSILPYDGRVVLFIAEPESRWNMYDGQPYHFGCVAIPYDEELSIDYLDTYQDTIIWDGDVTEDNVIVFAAVFSPDVYQGYAYPPNQNPFDAHPVDAATGVTPGETGYNTVTGEFSHTVFAEEATATWCPHCPDMAGKLYNIYQSGDYPFYFIALVADMLDEAYTRLGQVYNLYGYPTSFFDGGYKVLIGSGVPESQYRSSIETCGARDAHELNLSTTVTWLGNGDVQIDFGITNLETMYAPLDPDAPTGPDTGLTGLEYEYIASTTDPDEGDLFYWFDWGDNTNTGWIGPYDSGNEVNANHVWDEAGEYDVKVKVKDRAGHETNWSESLTVQIEIPEFSIDVAGELMGVVATITNTEEEAIPDVEWSLSVKGGILDLISSYSDGEFAVLGPGVGVEVRTNQSFFGLGKIDVTVTVEGIEETIQGFIIGPFVIIK
jgi:hypothetical protein